MGIDAGAPQPYWIWYAENQVAQDYGIRVSVQRKSKGLSKFGRTSLASTIATTIATFQGTETNETYVTTNLIDSIVSDANTDVNTITVEGHTIDAAGNLTFVTQDAVLTGTTAVTLSTPLARATRAFVKAGTFASPAVDLVGNVYVYDNTDGITNGVPNTAAATKCMISAGFNQSEKGSTSISSKDWWFIRRAVFSTARGGGSSVTVDCDIQWRALGGVWRQFGLEVSLRTAGQSTFQVDFEPMLIVPANSDVRMIATANAASTVVAGSMDGVLALELPRR